MDIANNRIYFYIPFSLIIIGLYRNSWLPGNSALIDKEIFIIFGISVAYLLLIIDFQKILNFDIKPVNVYDKYIVILFLLFLVSTIYNTHEVSSVKNAIRLIDYLFFFVIFFMIFPRLLLLPDMFRKFVLILAITGIWTAFFGIMLLFADIHPSPEFTGSLVSFIQQPNYVPFIFNLGILATLYYLDWQFDELSFFEKVLYIFSILIQIFALLLTLSRGAYIGLGVGIISYFIFKYRTKVLLITPFFLALIVIIVPPFFKAKGFASFISRLNLLIPAYIMIMKDNVSFLWGYGVTSALKTFEEYNGVYNITGDLRESQLNNPHNAVVSLMLMFGVVFTCVILFVVSLLLIRTVLKIFRLKNVKERLFFGFLVSVILSLVFQSIFDSEIVILEFFSMQILLVFLGFVTLLADKQKAESMLNFVNQ